jgi:putative addiction module antidote
VARKVFRAGNSAVVSLSPDTLEAVGLEVGDEVTIVAEADERRIVITPAAELPGVRSDFLERVDRFIERYRPALDRLAKE